MLDSFPIATGGNVTDNAGNLPGNIGNTIKMPSSDVTLRLSTRRDGPDDCRRDDAKKPMNIGVEGGVRRGSNPLTSCADPLCRSGLSTSSRRVNLKSGATIGGLKCGLSGCRTINPGLEMRYRIGAETGSKAADNLETVTPSVTVIAPVALPKADRVFHSFLSKGEAAGRHDSPRGVAP